MLTIATWNVNSIRARLPRIIEWLHEASPDIVLLQETKVINENFPSEEIEDLGYNIAKKGQKSYNGVAILSKFSIEDVVYNLPGDQSDEQARYIEAFTKNVRVASVYVPNGNPTLTDKFDYKLAWMDRLIKYAKEKLSQEDVLVIAGDYNVCPSSLDVYDPSGWVDDALCHPETRKRFRTLLNLGFTDAFRALNSGPGFYSFWDYTGGAWQKDFGLRIDHLLLSPEAADLLNDSGIDKNPRAKEKPSDHTPVWIQLKQNCSYSSGA